MTQMKFPTITWRVLKSDWYCQLQGSRSQQFELRYKLLGCFFCFLFLTLCICGVMITVKLYSWINEYDRVKNDRHNNANSYSNDVNIVLCCSSWDVSCSGSFSLHHPLLPHAATGLPSWTTPAIKLDTSLEPTPSTRPFSISLLHAL